MFAHRRTIESAVLFHDDSSTQRRPFGAMAPGVPDPASGNKGGAFNSGVPAMRRFELKYLISEPVAAELRDYIASWMVPDPHMPTLGGYTVSSLYLDSRDFVLYWSSSLGERDRLKLRIRAYPDRPEAPVFFEIKRRLDQIIVKERAVVGQGFLATALSGATPPDRAFVGAHPGQDRRNLERFQAIQDLLGAHPRVVVRYLREAWVANSGQDVRVSFDRRLAAGACPGETWPGPLAADGDWFDADPGAVVLEFKFADTFPPWLHHAAQRLNLCQDSFCKYCACVEAAKRCGDLALAPFARTADPLWSIAP